MPREGSIKVQCPTCKKRVKRTDPDFPFCTERCRLLDLGKWASGAYVISSPLHDTSDAVQENHQSEDDDG